MNHPLDAIAVRAFTQAMREERAGELLQHLFDGGGLTFDARFADGTVIWLPIWLPAEAVEFLSFPSTGATNDPP